MKNIVRQHHKESELCNVKNIFICEEGTLMETCRLSDKLVVVYRVYDNVYIYIYILF